VSRIDTEAPSSRRHAALKGWARRRLNSHIEAMTHWLGERPKRVIMWREDFDMLEDKPNDIKFIRNGLKPETHIVAIH